MSKSGTSSSAPILVLAATGKTGSRVVRLLEAAGHMVRRGSRSATPAFDWHDPAGWPAVLAGVRAAYVVYTPDLAAPGADRALRRFTEVAIEQGVERLVLLSGRGEPEAQACERIVLDAPVEATVIRPAWFAQNFSEGEFLELVQSGTVALPAADHVEPFVDVDDIAEVGVAALTGDGHDGEVYELTGPRLLGFREAVAEIEAASGKLVSYVPVSRVEFAEGLAEAGVPADFAELLDYLFGKLAEGHNACLADGVQRALGRAPRDFRDYARTAAATGVWGRPEPVEA